MGSGGRKPPETRGFGGKAHSAGRFLQFFDKNKTFLYFGQNSYFKAITHQLKAFKKQSKCSK